MNCKRIFLIVFFSILGLIISGAACYLLRKHAPQYTASTYIRVLPPIEPGSLNIGPAAGPAEYVHRKSLAKLINRQSNFEELINKDKVRETRWFKRFGQIKDISIPKAIKDLNKHFLAYAEKDADYITLSMTCGDKIESATIVNQMVDLFLDSQRVTRTGEVRDKLTTYNSQLTDVENELAEAEKAVSAVRNTTSFPDFEEHTYPNPFESRLIRLELDKDNCLLQINRLQTNIQNLSKPAADSSGEPVKQEHQADIKTARDNLSVLRTEYALLEDLRKEAVDKKRDYNSACVLYEQRVNIRNQIRERRNDVENQICKWKIMHNDPDTAGVRFIGYAPVPLEISSPKWIFYLPAGTILGLIFGIGLALLCRKPKTS